VEARRLVLWLADLDVHAFLGDLAGDTWNVDLNDRLGPLVVQICEYAEGHEHSSQKYAEQSIIVPGTQSSVLLYPRSEIRYARKCVRGANHKLQQLASGFPWGIGGYRRISILLP
jgi:hypothetical protein